MPYIIHALVYRYSLKLMQMQERSKHGVQFFTTCCQTEMRQSWWLICTIYNGKVLQIIFSAYHRPLSGGIEGKI